MCLCPTVRMPNGWLVGWLTAFSWPEGSCLLENKIQLHKNKNKRTQSSLLFLSVFCSLKSHAVTHMYKCNMCNVYWALVSYFRFKKKWLLFDLYSRRASSATMVMATPTPFTCPGAPTSSGSSLPAEQLDSVEQWFESCSGAQQAVIAVRLLSRADPRAAHVIHSFLHQRLLVASAIWRLEIQQANDPGNKQIPLIKKRGLGGRHIWPLYVRVFDCTPMLRQKVTFSSRNHKQTQTGERAGDLCVFRHSWTEHCRQ